MCLGVDDCTCARWGRLMGLLAEGKSGLSSRRRWPGKDDPKRALGLLLGLFTELFTVSLKGNEAASDLSA